LSVGLATTLRKKLLATETGMYGNINNNIAIIRDSYSASN